MHPLEDTLVPQPSWQKTPTGSLKINCDAAVFWHNNCSSWASVVRDEAGLFVATKSFKSTGIMEPKLAESLAVKEALTWCHEQHIMNAIIETDAAVVVHGIHSAEPDFTTCGRIVDDCRGLLSLTMGFIVNHIRRSANLVAHTLARAIDSLSNVNSWGDQPPSFLVSVLLLDSLN